MCGGGARGAGGLQGGQEAPWPARRGVAAAGVCPPYKEPLHFRLHRPPHAVANQAKFLLLFKRPGKVVLLGRRGDLLVRPSTIEHTAHRTSGTSLKQHML